MAKPKSKDEEFVPGPSKLDRSEQKRLTWLHVMRPGRNYLDATKPEYWYPSATQLAPMARIEVWSADHRTCFEVIVLEANPHASPHPQVDIFCRAIMPANLKLPKEQIVAPARWIAEQVSTSGNWQVRDTVTGQPIQVDLDRHRAMSLVGTLQQQAQQAEKERPDMAPDAQSPAAQ
jgi:hypothetical protein